MANPKIHAVDPNHPEPERSEAMLQLLQARFENHKHRHPGVAWERIHEALRAHPAKLIALREMEITGGEPDVIGQDSETDKFHFVDCSAETPIGRVSLCYDRAGLNSRKAHKPKNSAIDLASAWGVELLTEDQYRNLQSLGEFDLKTSSWLKTPDEIRRLGGALYAERRYGRVFVGHNGAQSYYSVRGFRVSLWV